MPNRKLRRPLNSVSRSRSSSDGGVNFTFFKSKMFLTLVAVALVVMCLAVYSSIVSTGPKPYSNNTMDQYRIDTNNLQKDSSAGTVVTH